MRKKTFQPDRVLSYFYAESQSLAIITGSGLVYKLGLLAGPWFEGRMAETLVRILQKNAAFSDMLALVCGYIATTALVQGMRYVKRFYVRRFANNVNRRMKETLYGNLVRKSRRELEQEGIGSVLTKAILDVDDCAEGMRKFTTEVFDTGVALAAYAGMLLWYDWRLALLCMIFPPVSYILAEKMKVVVQRTGAVYMEQSGVLSAATMDRASNALTYRIFGREQDRRRAYEAELADYEAKAVKANIWSSSLPPFTRSSPWRGPCSFSISAAETCWAPAGMPGLLRSSPPSWPALPSWRTSPTRRPSCSTPSIRPRCPGGGSSP